MEAASNRGDGQSLYLYLLIYKPVHVSCVWVCWTVHDKRWDESFNKTFSVWHSGVDREVTSMALFLQHWK